MTTFNYEDGYLHHYKPGEDPVGSFGPKYGGFYPAYLTSKNQNRLDDVKDTDKPPLDFDTLDLDWDDAPPDQKSAESKAIDREIPWRKIGHGLELHPSLQGCSSQGGKELGSPWLSGAAQSRASAEGADGQRPVQAGAAHPQLLPEQEQGAK